MQKVLKKEYDTLQTQVFTRWVNGHLKDINESELQDITQDLYTGVPLINLARVLTKKEPQAWKSKPVNKFGMVQNSDTAIQMFRADGVNIVNISGMDIYEKNTRLILGLIWSLILHYSIGKLIVNPDDAKSQKSSKSVLIMNWAVELSSKYPNVNNKFQPYDLSMCALLDCYVPEKINYYSLNQNDTEKNVTLANEVMTELGIPVYIYPDDVVKNGNQVDDKTLLTQLSSAKVVLDAMKVKERSAVIEDENTTTEKKSEETVEPNDTENTEKQPNEYADAISCLKYEVKKLKKEFRAYSAASQNGSEGTQNASHEEIERLTTKISEYESKIESLSARFESVEREVQTIKTTSGSINESESNANSDKWSDVINCLKYEVRKLKKEFRAHSAEHQSGTSEGTTELAQNESGEHEIFRKEIVSLTSKITECETRVSTLTESFESIKSEFHSQSKESNTTTKLTEEHEKIRTDLQSLTTLVNEKLSEFQSVKESLESLRTEVQLIKESSNGPTVTERSIQLGENENQEGSDEIEKLRNDNNSLAASIRCLKYEVRNLKNALKNGGANVAGDSQEEAVPEVKEREVTLNESDENEQLRKDVQSLQSDLEKLNAQMQKDNTKSYLFIFIILIVLLICIKLL